MTLKEPVNFKEENAAPICLPLPNNDYAGKKLAMAAWGMVEHNAEFGFPQYLQVANVVENSQQCLNDFADEEAFSNFNIDHELCSINQEGYGYANDHDDGGL